MRYIDRVASAEVPRRFRDVHLLIGGTGAVGGETLIKMLRVYADMARYHGLHPEEQGGPVLVATGRAKDSAGNPLPELKRFRRRLGTLAQAEFGASISRQGDTIRMPTGALVVLLDFNFRILGNLSKAIRHGDEPLEQYLAHRKQDEGSLVHGLRADIRQEAPWMDLLHTVRKVLDGWSFEKFRSVQIGIPIPSLLAYHVDAIEYLLARDLITEQDGADLKSEVRRQLVEQLSKVRGEAEAVIVAHTTAVGGMYDVTQQGDKRIRLGFAHAARDEHLQEKHQQAQDISSLYAEAGIWNLVTAAAIGIDDVRVDKPLAMAQAMRRALGLADAEPFPAAKQARYLHIYPPARLTLTSHGSQIRLRFDRMSRGREFRPSLALRSGENGYLSPANAEALYRVMRVASPSELGAVLAVVGSLGDDPVFPWFRSDEISGSASCYYRESDNSRFVFDFLAQPHVRSLQLTGMEPQALVDLGSAKHQAELHTLGLLILLHRLRTLDLDAIPSLISPDKFDPISFFEEKSRPLLFEDVQGWDIERLAEDLRILVLTDAPADLTALKDFRAREQERLAPKRVKVRDILFEAIINSVRAVTSLGSPIVLEDPAGSAFVRCGWWIGPLSIIAETEDSIRSWFQRRVEQLKVEGNEVLYEEVMAHHFAVNGFIDLRPHGIVACSRDDRGARDNVRSTKDAREFRRLVNNFLPYQAFSTCGLLAVLERLKGLADYLQMAQLKLGTHFDSAWSMPRDKHGHALVVPGIVEAFRMVSEGLEKSTGTEMLDGYWGYHSLGRYPKNG